ncbi:MAG TPA: carbon starvation CstA 5TM domain-containing protein, partial [Prolixibacteraceae bacterium]|nr:carbon starvation CstA 5TM domain-containing protein [Prolixibacteraceae bacterium]
SVLVIVATVAGIGLAYSGPDGQVMSGFAAWHRHYVSWEAAQGLTSKINAFVVGSSNMIEATGIPRQIALSLMGVFVASFAGTSLDTSTRLQRYFIEEILPEQTPAKWKNRYLLTAFVVITAALLAYSTGADGKGALKLWPLFGAVNQLLAALALIVLTLYLWKQNRRYWLYAGVPALFMTVVTLWASINNQFVFYEQHNLLLQFINTVIVLLAVSVFVSALFKILPPRGFRNE